ncbi:DUF1134 domain-containing protein [Novosphingobium sp.]|uniref:DUF1134 domain-containing protein n=1 Tax=Novosphingobium sp. TaxID=1874826 RepID=UPI0038B7F12B
MKPQRRLAYALVAAAALAAQATSAMAQVQSIDPNSAIDSDLSQSRAAPLAPPPAPPPPAPVPGPSWATNGATSGQAQTSAQAAPAAAQPSPAGNAYPPAAAGSRAGGTYREDDLIGAAEGVFGKGARGLALMIRDILKKQGEPNGYITGREGGGAFFVGLRYGSGTLHHRIEGDLPVYWTGPSLGLDLGASASNTFVLVYNLNDTEELFHRYGAGEGQAYLVGGFNVSYLRRGNVVIVPVRMGAGLRLGVNAGYMKFSHKQNWVPF